MSGLPWLGNPGRLLEAATHGRVILYTSPALVAELSSALRYQRLAQRVARSGLLIDELVARYLEVAIIVEPETVPQLVRDPDDNHVLACALAAQAELIVTEDSDLLELNICEQVPIITVAEAVRRIEV